jgi:hypothetical protein
MRPSDGATRAIQGLPDQLIHGRYYTFSVAENDMDGGGWVNSDYVVSMTENGVAFWSGTVDRFDAKLSFAQTQAMPR